MADDSRPRPPILKRFANLDIDGVGLVRQKPVKEKKAPPEAPIVTRAEPSGSRSQPSRAAPPAEVPSPSRRPETYRRDASGAIDPDLSALERLGTELNDNAQVSRQNATPRARRTARAAELRAMRPPDPRPSRVQPQDHYQPERSDRRQVSAEDLELDLPAELMTGGVVAVEVDLSRGRRGLEMRFETRQMPAQRMPDHDGPLWDLPRTTPPPWAGPAPRSQPGVNAFTEGRRADAPRTPRAGEPIELTPMAARQIQLMAWEAGVPGSPLRILTSSTPGLGHPEIDFAFDEDIAPDDIVVDALGVTVVIDPQSLVWVRGRRITWHDVPGSEGFSLR